ncbi:F-box only protein 36-like [Montipora capricornis]|uniref:F-box only protein 36-like n=1 Tax=Montipora capricornis TaxID=246305 RepID=UPI0035F10ADC
MGTASIDFFNGKNRESDHIKTINRSKVIFEKSGLGQAPSKDFFFLSVVQDSIIWRSWRITLRSDTSLPNETIQPWGVFVDSFDGKRLQEEIKRVFGVDTLNNVLSLVTKSWLPFLRSDILVEIILCLDLPDIVQLSQVCRTLYNVCSKDILWKRIYAKHFVAIPSESSEIYSVAQAIGWKKAFLLTWRKLHPSKTTKEGHVTHQNCKINLMLEENLFTKRNFKP